MNKEQFRTQIHQVESESSMHPLAYFLENTWVRQHNGQDQSAAAQKTLRWMGNEQNTQNPAIIKGELYTYPWQSIDFELGGKKHRLHTGDRIIMLHIDPIRQAERLETGKIKEYMNNLAVALHELANESIHQYYQYLIAGSWETLIYLLVSKVPAFSVVGVIQEVRYKDLIIQKATTYSAMHAQMLLNKPFPIVATTGLDFAECVFGHKLSSF